MDWALKLEVTFFEQTLFIHKRNHGDALII